MTIASEISDLQTNLTAAKNAVTAKGGTVGNTGLAGLASEIAGIPSGGGSTPTFAKVEFYPYIRPDSISITLERDANGHYTVFSNASTPTGVQITINDGAVDAGAEYFGITPSQIKYMTIQAKTGTNYDIVMTVQWLSTSGQLGGDEGTWDNQMSYWGFQIQGADTTGPVSTMDFNWSPTVAQGWSAPITTASGFKQWIPEYAIKQVTFTQSS